MSEPVFSIIVPAYGRPELLAEALASVVAQTFRDFECIVVDDASPVPLEIPDDQRFRPVRRTVNGGQPISWNTGLDHARGRFVTFLDDDDLFTPERLSLALEGLARAPLSICWAEWTDRRGRTSWKRMLEGDIKDRILDDVIPHVGQMAMRRDAVPRFDERFTLKADVEWWIRVAQRLPAATIPRVGYIWRTHSGPRLSSRDLDRARGNLLLLQVHSGYFAAHPRHAAYRWRRIGAAAYRLGEYRLARQAFGRAAQLRPDARTLFLFARSFRPSRPRAESLDLGGLLASSS